MVDYLIIGCGLSGIVLAERLAGKDKQIAIVDKNSHIGGLCYDSIDERSRIRYGNYGVHIFHTGNSTIFNYLLQFTNWNHYQHKVLSYVNGVFSPFPPSLDTPNLQRDFFDGYTAKQWGEYHKRLLSEVTDRIKTRVGNDERYFSDRYQGVPLNGYTEMFKRMLSSKNISIVLNTDYRKIVDEIKFNRLIVTSSLDNFFDYIYGRLPYRGIYFEHRLVDVEFYQPALQINYPNDYDFTRILEWKYLDSQKTHNTLITFEYPITSIGDKDYYPVLTKDSLALCQKYQLLAGKEKNTFFCGRGAQFKYLNMDKAVENAFQLINTEL